MSLRTARQAGRSGLAGSLAGSAGPDRPHRRWFPRSRSTAAPGPIATAQEQVAAVWATRASTAILVGALLLGPLAAVGVFALWSTRPTVQATTPTAGSSVPREAAVAGEFAQRVVVSWLTASQDNPGDLPELVASLQPSTLPRTPFTVADPAVAVTDQVAGAWSVTVAATVTDARKVTARRYYRVPVVVGDSVAVLALPAPVSPPQVSVLPTDYEETLAVDTPQGQAVAQFLTAYLTGGGDVGRYLTPGVTLTAVDPAPYVTVRLEDLSADAPDQPGAPADGERLQVLARATADVTAQQGSSLTYALTLTARAGRWEITALDLAPRFTTVAEKSSGTQAPASPEAEPPTPSGTPLGSTTP